MMLMIVVAVLLMTMKLVFSIELALYPSSPLRLDTHNLVQRKRIQRQHHSSSILAWTGHNVLDTCPFFSMLLLHHCPGIHAWCLRQTCGRVTHPSRSPRPPYALPRDAVHCHATFQVVLPWCPFGGWEYSREEEKSPPSSARATRANSMSKERQHGGDVNGEEGAPTSGAGGGAGADAEAWDNFAVAQKGAVWMEGYVEGYQAVRRRLWRRVYLEPGPASKLGGIKVVPPPV